MVESLKPKSSFEPCLAKLEKETSEAGFYLRGLIEDILPYDLPEYKDSPEDAIGIFNDEELEQLVDEIKISLIDAIDKKKWLVKVISNLVSVLESDYPVLTAYLKPRLFDGLFDVPEVENTEGDDGVRYIVKERPYILPNITLSRRDVRVLYVAMGLVEDSSAGKGDHTKFYDPNGEMARPMIAAYNAADKKYIKNIVKELLSNGMPLERIAQACWDCNIDFRWKE